jgi:hypothetical protein
MTKPNQTKPKNLKVEEEPIIDWEGAWGRAESVRRREIGSEGE